MRGDSGFELGWCRRLVVKDRLCAQHERDDQLPRESGNGPLLMISSHLLQRAHDTRFPLRWRPDGAIPGLEPLMPPRPIEYTRLTRRTRLRGFKTMTHDTDDAPQNGSARLDLDETENRRQAPAAAPRGGAPDLAELLRTGERWGWVDDDGAIHVRAGRFNEDRVVARVPPSKRAETIANLLLRFQELEDRYAALLKESAPVEESGPQPQVAAVLRPLGRGRRGHRRLRQPARPGARRDRPDRGPARRGPGRQARAGRAGRECSPSRTSGGSPVRPWTS